MGKVEVHSRDTNPVVKDAHGVNKAQHYIAIISAELVGLCRRSRGHNRCSTCVKFKPCMLAEFVPLY